MDAGSDHLLDGVIPAVARISILALGTDVPDLVLYLMGGTPQLALPVVVADLAAGRRRPYRAGDELQQLGLPGAVRTCQHPPLAGTDGPAHILENPPPVAIEAHAVQAHCDVTGMPG